MERRNKFMFEALAEASLAMQAGEVPIGAVIVKNDCVVSRSHNRTETDEDPTAHAEILAIREAAKTLGTSRLVGCELFVTAEPCTMCAGACILARLDAVYAGTKSPKSGAAGSVKDVLTGGELNHIVHYETGIMREECAAMLSKFFRDLRTNPKGNE
jgi:tRNA(adenine34) deaminase